MMTFDLRSGVFRRLAFLVCLTTYAACSAVPLEPRGALLPHDPPGQGQGHDHGHPPPPPQHDDHSHDHDHDHVEHHHDAAHHMMFWLPNRLFDIFDIVRARVRLGPGFGIGARCTEFLDINLGAWKTVFVGIHGPRGRPEIPWPVGFDYMQGLEFSVFDGTDENFGRHAPHYGIMEIGAGIQLVIVGFDVGVEPFEVLDFLAGIFFLDPSHDDY